jgi:DNA topoisomerase-2
LPVQATNKNRVLSFYTLPEYESWKESLNGETKGWTIKYYKVCSYFSGDLLPC